MSLIIKIAEGGDVYIGDRHFKVADVSPRGDSYRITDLANPTVAVDVSIGCPALFDVHGHKVIVESDVNLYLTRGAPRAILRVTAPLEVTIVRGDLYRKNGRRFVVSSAVRSAIRDGRGIFSSGEWTVPLLLAAADRGHQMGCELRCGNITLVLQGNVIIDVR